MIDEAFLSTLADPGAGPATTTCRPVSAVLARARQLQRRRRAARSAGIATIAVGVLCTGFVVANRQGTEQSERVNSASTTTTDKPSGPPPPYVPCSSLAQVVANPPDRLTPADVPDNMRLLPSWLPDGVSLEGVSGNRQKATCPDTARYPVDAALALSATNAEGVVDRSIHLEGPLPFSQEQDMADGRGTWGSGVEHGSTPFRDGTATFVHGGAYDPNLRFDWTDADGWSWELWGSNVDEATLRAVGEALVLDSSPEGDEPVASLPAGAVPAGLRVNWQQLGTPAVYPSGDSVTWTISAGRSDQPSTGGITCMAEVTRRVGEMPLASAGYYGSSHETVNGHDAVRFTPMVQDPVVGGGNTLRWEISPGVQVQAGCADFSGSGFRPLPLDQVKRFAESLEPVAADDPRLS